MTTSGVVYLVGAGPGDPGLLTLRGAELLVGCDAVVYDALANPALLALARVADRAAPVELHDVGKRGGADVSARQDDICALLVRLASEGKRVVRLKGGDPFVFGRGSEEAQALAAAGVRFEVVPGVTAGIAAAAYAGIPVTHRGAATSVTFVTGHEDPLKPAESVDWTALAHGGGTIVLYMGVKTLPRTTAALQDAGMSPDTPAAAVQWGTYPRQRTCVATLATLTDTVQRAGLGAPIITIIGPVVALREEIAWFEHRPLFGRRIVVTRATEQAPALSDHLAALGAEVIEAPATRIEPTNDGRLRAAVSDVSRYHWAIFTSQNAVRLFWDALRADGGDARALAGVRLAAVGPSTAAALLDCGLVVDVQPERFVAESLLESLRTHGELDGARVLYAAAEGAREALPDGLRALGAVVDTLPLYRSVPDGTGADSLRARLQSGEVDMVTYTSASCVRALVGAIGVETARVAAAASIGPITSAALREAGLEPAIEAAESTIVGLVQAIVEHAARR